MPPFSTGPSTASVVEPLNPIRTMKLCLRAFVPPLLETESSNSTVSAGKVRVPRAEQGAAPFRY